MTNHPEFRLVRIDWVDSNIHAGWEFLSVLLREALRNTLRIRSVGWLVHSDEVRRILAPHLGAQDGDPQASGIIEIPVVSILEEREIEG